MYAIRGFLILVMVSQVAACQATPQMIATPSAAPLTCERIRQLSMLNMEMKVTSSRSEFATWLSASPEFSRAVEQTGKVPNNRFLDYVLPGGGFVVAEFSESGRRKVSFGPQSAIALDLRSVVECVGQPDYYLFYGTEETNAKVGVGVTLFYLQYGLVVVASKIPETVHIAHTADVNQILVVELIRVENGSLDAVFDSAFLAERDPYAKPKVFRYIRPWPGDLLKMDADSGF